MRAAVLRAYDRPLELVRRPDPHPGPGEVVVAVVAVGVCGSDLFLTKGGFGSVLPVVPGHEIAGTVEAVGDGVDPSLQGAHVAVYYIIHDGTCRMCQSGRPNLCTSLQRIGVDRDGGFADRLVVPAANVIRVPERIPFADVAVLTDAVATPYHALTTVGGLRAGEDVVVMGIGGIGSNAVQLAARLQARVIAVSRSPRNLRLASELGAADTVVADDRMLDRIRELTGPEGPRLVVQTVGSATVDAQAVAAVGLGGRVVLIGAAQEPFAVRATDLIWKEAEVRGSRGYTPDDIRTVVDWWQAGDITTAHLVAHRRPLDEAQAALDDLRSGAVLRTVLEPQA